MWTNKIQLWRFTLCILLTIGTLAYTVQGDDEVPSESQCRPYIEKALKELETGETHSGSVEENDSNEVGVRNTDTKDDTSAENVASVESNEEDTPSVEVADESYVEQESVDSVEGEQIDDNKSKSSEEDDDDDDKKNSKENDDDDNDDDSKEGGEKNESKEDDDKGDSKEDDENGEENSAEDKNDDSKENTDDGDSKEETSADVATPEQDSTEEQDKSDEANSAEDKKEGEEADDSESDDDGKSGEEAADGTESSEDKVSAEDTDASNEKDGGVDDNSSEKGKSDTEEDKDSGEKPSIDQSTEDNDNSEEVGENKSKEDGSDDTNENDDKSKEDSSDEKDDGDDDDDDSEEGAPEEDLLKVGEIPKNLRSREHIVKILRLDEEASESEITIERSADIILRDLKRLYETAIKPLETLYKYRDLSNRHFGDPEIFSKPLVLFMGPWSGGKSSILNYLTGIEFTEWSLRTGAEPSPAYFNILMHGKEPEVLDGTQLAADWTFSGLQKFGQGLEERLRGLKYPSKLLEKVNIVEIPGILEVRKQVSRVFPFNDACQWFIDRADIIFLVYDPSKLDVGPETEAILDQLKGREPQSRILLNKADTVKPEELMRVQSALIWNISPLMSSAQPPIMYTVSLWSMPFEAGAPVRLLQAQERELLRDLREAVDKRIENKIASARRFAVRVRNHAKMVDCYLTTYYNHKTIFGNKKLIAEAIIENPQNYHIYEGLSTLTNISRYDLPDPETYRDFFRLNSLYEFQQLSATCTYFRGCPINRLDVAIAYDLPELVGKYKKMVENATPQGMPKS